MIIGREKEIKKLNELYDSGSAELVALYGRRRVGKTFLIDETFQGRIAFRHSGLSPVEEAEDDDGSHKSRMKEQLEHFHRSLVKYGMKGSREPSSWLEAFYMLEDLLEKKNNKSDRMLIFIDEIQWLDTPKAGFMTGFEAFWNGWACHEKNVMVIVCGSSTSWILDKLINSKGGLYDRITSQILLQPFTLAECEEYFKAEGVVMSRYDIVQAYMMVGGIPYYLRYFNRELSFAQNIESIFFTPNAPLKDEYDRLFASLFVNPKTMKTIVSAIGEKNIGITRKEIVSKTGVPDGGDLSKYLKALISGSFITKYTSFGGSKREELYKLADPFCIFHLRFMDNRSDKKINWVNFANGQPVIVWRGYAFENVCFNHINQIKDALGISGVTTSESMWSKTGVEGDSGTQIDLIIDRMDNVINMCEIKFYNDEFTVNKNYHFTLVRRNKVLTEHIPKRSIIHNVLITTYGLKRNEYSGDFIKVVTLDDLFR